MSRPIESLSPKEVLALAVHVERANTRRFQAFAGVFRGFEPEVAEKLEELAEEEIEHERLLTVRFEARYEGEIPNVDEVTVEGVIESVDLDDAEHLIFNSLKPRQVYEIALKAELGAQAFYRRVAGAAEDEELAALYLELADMEDDHAQWLKDKLETCS